MAELENPTPAQVQACREEHGEAHDMQVQFAGECSWCGYYDPSVEEGHVDEVTGNIYDAHGNLLEQHYFGD